LVEYPKLALNPSKQTQVKEPKPIPDKEVVVCKNRHRQIGKKNEVKVEFGKKKRDFVYCSENDLD
jgi:hypothetical protein